MLRPLLPFAAPVLKEPRDTKDLSFELFPPLPPPFNARALSLSPPSPPHRVVRIHSLLPARTTLTSVSPPSIETVNSKQILRLFFPFRLSSLNQVIPLGRPPSHHVERDDSTSPPSHFLACPEGKWYAVVLGFPFVLSFRTSDDWGVWHKTYGS